MKKLIAFATLITISVVLLSCFNKSDAVENIESSKIELTSPKIELLTKSTFKAKIFDYEANKDWNYVGKVPAIIDFYADWCRPCKMVAPILEELNKEYNGKIVIYKVNTQVEQELSTVFGITGIPAFLFIPAEGQPQMSTGFMTKENFEQAITEVLKVKK
jgi:thioredoxin 1